MESSLPWRAQEHSCFIRAPMTRLLGIVCISFSCITVCDGLRSGLRSVPELSFDELQLTARVKRRRNSSLEPNSALPSFRDVEVGKVYFKYYEAEWQENFGMTLDEYWDILYPRGKVEQWSEKKLNAVTPWTKHMYINLNHIHKTGRWIGSMGRMWGKPVRLMNMEDLRRAKENYWNKVAGKIHTVNKAVSAMFTNRSVSIASVHLESDRFIDPHFIEQGWTGDCWLLSAFSLMGQRKEFLRRVFRPSLSVDARSVQRNKDLGDVGYYTLRLFDPFADDGVGQWQDVEIDDYVPVLLDDDGYPVAYNVRAVDLYHDGKDNDVHRAVGSRHASDADLRIDMVIWPLILEKAWSRWMWTGVPEEAGFTSLDIRNQGGLVEIGMLGMMGQPMKVHRFLRKRVYWEHGVIDFKKIRTRYPSKNWTWPQRLLAGFYAENTWDERELITPEEFVSDHLIAAGYQGYPITCDRQSKNKEGDDESTFVRSHAYSVTIGSSIANMPRINVRNPWGMTNLEDRSGGGDTIIRHWHRTGGVRHDGFLQEFDGIVIMEQKGREVPGFGDFWVDGVSAPGSRLRNIAPKGYPAGNLWQLLS